MEYFDLNRHVFRLLQDEPFFSVISRHIEKIPSKALPTAGVRVNESGYFEMLYNPDFFSKLTDVEIKLVLMHEFFHLVFDHVTERLPDEGMTRLWNIATDCAINSELFNMSAFKSKKSETVNLREMAVFPSKFKLPDGKAAEWYYTALKQKIDEIKSNENGEDEPGGEGFDNHDGWSSDGENTIPEEVKELAKQRMREAAQEAAQEANNRSWGNISASMQQEIIKKLQSKIDWKKVLRYFVKTSQRAEKMSTVKKINRRFPYIHSGRKANRTSKIAVSIDQSGSVSNKMLEAFYAELNKLSTIAEFTVIPFDTDVADDKVYVWKRGQNRNTERVLCGGTDFNAPTKWVNEREFDGHIVLTDMYAPRPIASKCQRMWMTDKECARQPYFTTNERIIAIDYQDQN